MSSKYDVSVVIINYNSKRYIDKLFESLERLKHDDFTFQVVVIDNASTDDSIEYLKSKNYNVDIKYVMSDINRGFAGGNNYGVAGADGEYIVFLNNDTAVDENWLSELYHFIKSRPDCVMANSKLLFFYDFIELTFKTSDKMIFARDIAINDKSYYGDGKFITNCLCEPKELVCFGHTTIKLPILDMTGAHSFVLDAKQFNNATDCVIVGGKEYKADEQGKVVIELTADEVEANRITLIQNAGSGLDANYNGYDRGFCKLDGPEYSEVCEIGNGCGAAIIMKKSDFDSVGGFDESFFMYYEDTDLSYRMKKNGGKIYYCPTAIVRHIHTGSSTEWSPFFTYHVYRNKLLFVYKNFGKKAFYYYYARQMYEAIRYRDKAKLGGCSDAIRMAVKKKEPINKP